MTIDSITKEFREKVCKEILLQSEGINRYIVHTQLRLEEYLENYR